ncbi:hypothetical protein GCM10017783_00720 [Deinococcus piscis]|uniref:Secreted protein n=1 Tax=Deinococcus piscis TaxID=394230 RepID=A0ABQ3JY18_9DEIO|nr:hypothetical protein GCM10017783_00720 [Deinococcus piscis]
MLAAGVAEAALVSLLAGAAGSDGAGAPLGAEVVAGSEVALDEAVSVVTVCWVTVRVVLFSSVSVQPTKAAASSNEASSGRGE